MRGCMHDKSLILHTCKTCCINWVQQQCMWFDHQTPMWLFWPVASCTMQIQARLLFRTGTNVRRPYININNALERIKYGHAMCCTLSWLHAFSGCDSTSYFVGCGKKTGLTLISWASDGAARQAMTCLRRVTCWTCKQFVYQLYTCTYGLKTHMSINELRHGMFYKDFSCLQRRMHCISTPIRENYHTVISIQALAAKPDFPGHARHGWHVSNGHWKKLLEFNWWHACGC